MTRFNLILLSFLFVACATPSSPHEPKGLVYLKAIQSVGGAKPLTEQQLNGILASIENENERLLLRLYSEKISCLDRTFDQPEMICPVQMVPQTHPFADSVPLLAQIPNKYLDFITEIYRCNYFKLMTDDDLAHLACLARLENQWAKEKKRTQIFPLKISPRTTLLETWLSWGQIQEGSDGPRYRTFDNVVTAGSELGLNLAFQTKRQHVPIQLRLTVPEKPENFPCTSCRPGQMKISKDRKTVIVNLQTDSSGVFGFSWGFEKEDPRGFYRIEYDLEGHFIEAFDFEFR